MKPVIIAHNIISSLGLTSAENYAAVKSYSSGVRRYEDSRLSPQPFAASTIDREKLGRIDGKYTYFEKLAILSISEALTHCDIDAASPSTLFVISTTKGNVDMRRNNGEGIPEDRLSLGVAARAIARYFGNENLPIVVSNACTSGLCAQITASRLLLFKDYENIIVCGAEALSPFIVSGFQSLMALSDEPCRPFDMERVGINLGEAAATMIYSKREARSNEWIAVDGAIRNDAYHISNPSRTAEGSYRCLKYIMDKAKVDDIALINAHGTATLYNDEMEAKAIARAELLSVPVNSLKGYYGHTMGAAGVVETIITMMALDENLILGTKGFETLGVSKRLDISNEHRSTNKHSFIKLISGFGGCNAAMLFRKEGER